jgi:tetratricopeptide (TPR) repeat protein
VNGAVPPDKIITAPAPGAPALAQYDRRCALGEETQGRAALLQSLSQCGEDAWLDCAQRLVLGGRVAVAIEVLSAAHARHPDSAAVTVALAGLYRQARQDGQSETLLSQLLAAQPAHAQAALLLARLFRDAGRMHAAASTLEVAFASEQPADVVIQALELLDDCDRKAAAANVAQAQIAAGCTDPRIHAYAATYEIQLGQFDSARRHYLYALKHSPQAMEWHVAYGLSQAQRYQDAGHPDCALFAEWLKRDMSEPARTTLLFALGKAFDDIGDPAQAAGYLRQANELAHARSSWSRKLWRRGIDARVQYVRPAFPSRSADSQWTPIFVVGVPRSGTTLVAELLARYPKVCNRGELRGIWQLSQRLPTSTSPTPAQLDELAGGYAAQLIQDDPGDARWFIDKQPLNLLHVDLILALWPHARIIHCQRNARDTALSLWMQFFLQDTHAYAYDMGDIAAVLQGCSRLMAHWKKLFAPSIYSLDYEHLTAVPAQCIGALATWLELPPGDPLAAPSSTQAINTASLWQARQPVYTRSVGKWRAYAPYLPELLKLPQN